MAQATDRFVMVQAVHGLFCSLVQHTLQSRKSNDPLNGYDKELLEVRRLCRNKIPLQVVLNFKGYTFLNAANNRFMGTTADANSPILASAEVLNADDFAQAPLKPINFILQTLMHEYTNKISGLDQGTKDILAREFAKRYYAYESLVEGEAMNAVLFSLPTSKVDVDFAEVEMDRVQPGFLMLLESQGVFHDVTSAIDNQVTGLSPKLRSVWTESNRMALAILPKLMSELRKQIATQFPQMIREFEKKARAEAAAKGIDPAQVDKLDFSSMQEKFSDFVDVFEAFNSDEMRLFEINQVRLQAGDAGETLVVIQSTFALNRSKIDFMKSLKDDVEGLTFDGDGGAGIKKIIHVPLIIKLRLKNQNTKLQIVEIGADLRPELSYQKIAKVGQISRSGDLIKSVKVKLDLAQKPKLASLRLALGSEYVLIPATQIEEARAGQYSFTFEVPEYIQNIHGALWAESVLIDQGKAYMLDRLVQISEGPKQPKAVATAQLVTPGLLIRSMNNQVRVAQEFHPLIPLLLMNQNWYQFITSGGHRAEMDSASWMNMDGMELRFGITGNQKIRQVRLQMSYDVAVGAPKDEDRKNAFTGTVNVDGQDLKTWSDVSVEDQENYYQTIIFSAEDLQVRQSGNMNVVTAKAKVPFIPLPRPLKAGHGYGPPMVRPLKVEVVLDDGQMTTISHIFPVIDMPDCDDLLGAMKFEFK